MIIIPRLFPSIWQNKLNLIEDLVLTIPVETSFCSKPMHETLTLVIILHLDTNRPSKRIISKWLLEMERQMCNMW